MARRYGADHQLVGSKLGPKIALLVGHVMQDHLRRTAGYRAQIGADAAVKFFATIEAERKNHLSPLLGLWMGHEQTHEHVERVLRFMHSGSGELSSLLSEGAAAGAIGNGIGSGLANELAPVNQALMYATPNQILDPTTMAALAAGRIVSVGYAERIARMSGIPEGATGYLIEAAHQQPPLALALEFWRRGFISQPQYEYILRRQAFPEDFINAALELRQQILSPEDLALLVLKGIRSEDQVRGEAAANGIDAARLSELVAMSGEPLGLEQLQEAFRREYIDQKRLEHGIRQSRVRNEWTDVVLKLRFSRASPADALRGVVQNHIPAAEGERIARENGLDPRDWKWLLETEGNPAAPGEMITLWRRGKASQAQVEQALRESRVKNKYIPALLNLRRNIPPLFQVSRMLQAGSIDEREAARLFTELGYEPDVVKGLVHAGTHTKVAKDKELAKAEVEELYYDHAIDEARATEMLKALGYNTANVRLLLALVTLRREKALRQAAMAPIRSAYTARHIDEHEAITRLDALGIPHEQRDFVLRLWTVDREAHHAQLTVAEITKANAAGLLSDAAAESELLDKGYRLHDARILIDLEKGRRTPAP